ncbi:MAG: hypothetical protein AMXMBFR45_19570 [Gammaproteobacteria bacterium]|nr:MAG: nuclease/helicase [Gammaproteobacteria bacterium]
MTSTRPPDQAERDAALDPGRSFIVQAPAGSGKTELLIQRYLSLLATVTEPEEVLAVTFTHKAAGEMRSRVISALVEAQHQRPPAAPHLRRAYDLAREVLGDEQRQQWQLHRHPARLRICTIDALNRSIASRSPIAGGASALQDIAPAPERLYAAAALATLGLMADDDAAGAEVDALMRHLDNNAARFQQLVVAMLQRRDQWLRHALNSSPERSIVEAPLRHLTDIGIEAVAAALPADAVAEIVGLLPYAAGVLAESGDGAALAPWLGRTAMPAPTADEWPAWKALADLLLKTDSCWRRSVSRKNGFPPKTTEKALMEGLLGDLSGLESLRAALDAVRRLPGAGYTDQQWEALRSLLNVLRLAAAELQLVHAAHGATDFAGVAAAALEALGGPDAPSDLALALDHRLRHILVDEFQDTSLAQFTLLERLTAGWAPGDGRSLFVVGDPMQSIYGFREADVGLFAQLRDQGIGDLRPGFLQLRTNFRSLPALVDWCNSVFSRTFATADDTLVGAVQFAPSMHAPGAGPQWDGRQQQAVACHWLAADDRDAEPALVLDLVTRAQQEDPSQRICILVRNRGHATPIIAALRAAGMGFVAPEIEILEHSTVALDLLALARALSHRADRLAWIGVLRAPWCGLSLADLDCLLGDDHDAAVVDLLHDQARLRRLSPAGAAALRRLCLVLDRVESVRERRGLRDLVEGAWLMLGGPATVPEASQLESAASFLGLLDDVEATGDSLDLEWLAGQIRARKGSLGSGDAGLQIMTIHKAKGLEFDTVILPGLGRASRGDDTRLMLWQDVPMADGHKAPILAPISATGEDRDPVYVCLRDLEARRRALELDRLLYVACTRARRRLHLVGQLAAHEDGGEVRQPRAGSLLARLWPAVAASANAEVAETGREARAKAAEAQVPQPIIRRLPADWQAPAPPAPLPLSTAGPEPAMAEPVVYEWAGHLAMHVGTVVHRWLQVIAEEGLASCTPEWLRGRQPLVRRMLSDLGVPSLELDAATSRVSEALERTLSDPRGRWLLDSIHGEAASELALTVCEDGRFRNLVVDRTFRDATDGTRWVIDFKTSQHQGGDLEAFIQVEVGRHREQLLGYQKALAALTGEPVRTALYYPLLGIFREVVAESGRQA